MICGKTIEDFNFCNECIFEMSDCHPDLEKLMCFVDTFLFVEESKRLIAYLDSIEEYSDCNCFEYDDQAHCLDLSFYLKFKTKNEQYCVEFKILIKD